MASPHAGTGMHGMILPISHPSAQCTQSVRERKPSTYRLVRGSQRIHLIKIQACLCEIHTVLGCGECIENTMQKEHNILVLSSRSKILKALVDVLQS